MQCFPLYKQFNVHDGMYVKNRAQC